MEKSLWKVTMSNIAIVLLTLMLLMILYIIISPSEIHHYQDTPVRDTLVLIVIKP